MAKAKGLRMAVMFFGALHTLFCNGFSIHSTNRNLKFATTSPVASYSYHRTSPIPLTRPVTPTALCVSANEGESVAYTNVDWSAIAKYSMGLGVQMALLFGFLRVVDQLVAKLSLQIPFVVNFLFLYAFNLKSSLFSIFPQRKSDGRKLKQENWEYNKRNKPTWTPPGFAFVIGWPILTFGLRAFTGAMVVQSIGTYANPTIMSLMLHLGIGNLWNTVNNVERRLGVSVVLLYSLWLSKAFAAFRFFKVQPLAGKLLALTLTWITAACALETRTWQINPDPDTKKREPLIPMKHPKWNTRFKWEQQ